MKTTIVPVPLDHLDDVWPYIGEHVVRGIEAAQCERHVLAAQILSGDATVWVIADDSNERPLGAFMTRVVVDDGARRLWVWGLSGERARRWADAIGTTMVEAGRRTGCVSVRFVGKDAWARLVPDVQRIGTHETGIGIFERAVA